MRHQPGEYIAVVWDYDTPSCEAVHGHVDLAAVNAALASEGIPEFEDTVEVRHTYWRKVPCHRDNYDNRFVFDCARGPGAFPVTVVDL